MSKDQETKSGIKKWFAGFLLLISFIADIIAISELRVFQSTIQQINITNSPAYNQNFNPPTFGGLTIDDAVILTGLFTAFVIANLYYVASKTKEITDKYSYLIATFLSLLLTYLYFRLWIGEKWWIFACVIPLVFVVLVFIGVIGGNMSGNRRVAANSTNISLGEAPVLDNNNGQPYILPTNLNQSGFPYSIPLQPLDQYINNDMSQVNQQDGYIGLPNSMWETVKKDLGVDGETIKKDVGFDKETLKKDLGFDKGIIDLLFGSSEDNTDKNENQKK